MTPEIIPSILVDSATEFERRLKLVENHCTTVHVDVLDGTLFPFTSWYDAEAVAKLGSNVKIELHLMVENPLPIVQAWHKHVSGLKRAIVHAEIHRPLGAVIERLEVMKLETGIAMNPETPLSAIHDHLHKIHQLTVMGVHPGASGQSFLGESVLETIREARKHRSDLVIEMDGGLTQELIPSCIQAGAQRLCAASLLFSSTDPVEALRTAQTLLSTTTKK